MLSKDAKEQFKLLNMEYHPIAVKFSYNLPEDLEPADEENAFCQFVKRAQVEHKSFYITAQNENCFGQMILGMVDKPPFAASGQAGVDFGVYKTQAPNARLYTEIPALTKGSVNYVSFSPVDQCNFDPDLIICLANTSQADIIMRASSYISGDLWESKSSCVLSCAWTYIHPYLTGKINTCITGMHHGMKRRKTYPEGLHIISIPYQKIDEVVVALQQMDWELIAMKEDELSKAELKRRMDAWKDMEKASGVMPKA